MLPSIPVLIKLWSFHFSEQQRKVEKNEVDMNFPRKVSTIC